MTCLLPLSLFYLAALFIIIFIFLILFNSFIYYNFHVYFIIIFILILFLFSSFIYYHYFCLFYYHSYIIFIQQFYLCCQSALRQFDHLSDPPARVQMCPSERISTSTHALPTPPPGICPYAGFPHTVAKTVTREV